MLSVKWDERYQRNRRGRKERGNTGRMEIRGDSWLKNSFVKNENYQKNLRDTTRS
jgi:hypothetical protein